jgi:hypothetical protein
MEGVAAAHFLLAGLAVYGAAGVAVGVAFAVAGVTRALPADRATIGARILLLPAAAALWPVVLRRWLGALLRR